MKAGLKRLRMIKGQLALSCLARDDSGIMGENGWSNEQSSSFRDIEPKRRCPQCQEQAFLLPAFSGRHCEFLAGMKHGQFRKANSEEQMPPLSYLT